MDSLINLKAPWFFPMATQTLTRQLTDAFNWYNEHIGGTLIMILLVPTGIYFAFRFKFLHLHKLGHAFSIILGKYDKKEDTGDINFFKALTTALSATIGTGNIVGVSLAIYYGGPGAIFWMWVTGLFGMMLKFVECTLSFMYRKVNPDGSISGGPMYYMELGLKDKLGRFAKILAVVFAAATALSSLGQGNMAQANSIADSVSKYAQELGYACPTWASGLVMAGLVLMVIVGGIKRIAEVTSKLVPFMGLLYLSGALIVIISFIDAMPQALVLIFKDAFSSKAATGGFIGATFIMVMRKGISRGLFSNEAGQGSAAIALAASKTKYPIRVGLVSSIGPFIDTLVICSLTALVIILTDSWDCGKEGVGMTIHAFEKGFTPLGIHRYAGDLVTFTLVLFAFSTMISWSYYGVKCAEYLFGPRSTRPYQYLFCIMIFLGAIGKIDLVWSFVDMAVSLMTIPNLIAILILAPMLHPHIRTYFKAMKAGFPESDDPTSTDGGGHESTD